MMQRVFVRVEGFSSVERHALNTVFRLSQDHRSAREWSYEPWGADSPTAPRLALIDGASPSASECLSDIEAMGGIGIIWVGSISPAKAWRAFSRPLLWPDLLSAMDDYFTPSNNLDVDFGHDTWPSVLESTGAHMFGEPDPRRVLLADADSDTRLYLRTKLASYGITHIDEVSNVLEARDFLSPMRSHALQLGQPPLLESQLRTGYDLIMVDLDLPGGDPWAVIGAAGRPRLKIVMQHRLSFSSRMNAKMNGCTAMSKPLHPTRLNELIEKI